MGLNKDRSEGIAITKWMALQTLRRLAQFDFKPSRMIPILLCLNMNFTITILSKRSPGLAA